MAAKPQTAAAASPNSMVPRGARYGRGISGAFRRNSHTATFGRQMPMRYVKLAAAITQTGSPPIKKSVAITAVNRIATHGASSRFRERGYWSRST
jgi:hypothetical protein